jgi:hypothetical protein
MEQGFEREERFDLKAQEEILGIASRISSENLSTASIEDLVRTGAELGLTREQVESAVAHYKLGDPPSSVTVEGSPAPSYDILSNTLLAVLLMPTLGLAWFWMKTAPPSDFFFYLAFGLCLGLGIASANRPKQLLRSLVGIVLILALSLGLARVFKELFPQGGELTADWIRYSLRTLLAELGFLGAGYLVSGLLNRKRKGDSQPKGQAQAES